jgi:hypothetical protein
VKAADISDILNLGACGAQLSLRRPRYCILASLYLRRNYASIFRSA